MTRKRQVSASRETTNLSPPALDQRSSALPALPAWERRAGCCSLVRLVGVSGTVSVSTLLHFWREGGATSVRNLDGRRSCMPSSVPNRAKRLFTSAHTECASSIATPRIDSLGERTTCPIRSCKLLMNRAAGGRILPFPTSWSVSHFFCVRFSVRHNLKSLRLSLWRSV